MGKADLSSSRVSLVFERTSIPIVSANWKPNAKKLRQNNYPPLSILDRLIRRIVERKEK